MRNVETDLLPMHAVSEADAKLFIEWMRTQRVSTDLDPAALGYPRAIMVRVKQADDTIAMAPLHPVLMVESLSRNSKLTNSQLVLVLLSINDKLQQVMQDSGMAEAWFETNSEHFVDVCCRCGWEIALHDQDKQKWMLKKRARIDWAKLVETTNENDHDTPDAKL